MFSRITVKKESCGPGPSVGHVLLQGCDKMLTSLVHRRKRRGQLYRRTAKTVPGLAEDMDSTMGSTCLKVMVR